MTQDQKYAGALLAIATLLVLAAYTLSLGYLTCKGLYAIDPDSLESEFYFPWKIAIFFIDLGTGINIMLGGFIALISTCTGWITEVFTKRWQLGAVVALCVIGILTALYVLIDTGDVAVAELRYFGKLYQGLENAEALEKSRLGLIAFGSELIAAFTFFLGSRLGIEGADPDGKVRKFLKRTFGEGGEK